MRTLYVNGHKVSCSVRCIRARRDDCDCRCHGSHHQGKGLPAGAQLSERDPEAARLRDDYFAYLESRHDAAEEATRGNLLADRAPAHLTGERFFNGRRGPRRHASEELRDWFRANGPNLTYAEFRAQQTEQADDGGLGYPGGY